MGAEATQRKAEPRDKEKWSSPTSPKTLDPARLKSALTTSKDFSASYYQPRNSFGCLIQVDLGFVTCKLKCFLIENQLLTETQT